MIKKKVLIVDDDPNVIRSLSFILEKEGYIVIAASDGEEALRKIKEELPHLIILDIMLPKIDGFQVYKRLKANAKTKGISVIILTAKGEEKDKRLGRELGVDAYITKPFDIDALLSEVRKILNQDQAS